ASASSTYDPAEQPDRPLAASNEPFVALRTGLVLSPSYHHVPGTTHGHISSGPPVFAPQPPARAGVSVGSHRHTRAGHWGDHRHLHDAQRGAAEAAAVSERQRPLQRQ